MKPEYKEKLLSALRSGKYRFGREQLYDPKTNCFCVLGVLADLLVKEFPDKYQWQKDRVYEVNSCGWSLRSTLPTSMVKLVGLSDSLGRLTDGSTSLADINDQSTSFDPVIKAIEENF